MLQNDHLDTMDREELIRLAGEQALLRQELTKLAAEQNRELNVLRNLGNAIGSKTDWLEDGIALLRRLDERQRTQGDGYRRMAEFKKLTGID